MFQCAFVETDELIALAANCFRDSREPLTVKAINAMIFCGCSARDGQNGVSSYLIASAVIELPRLYPSSASLKRDVL